MKYSVIKILSLNAGGLGNKSKNPEFVETISNYDIVCIQETHFDACLPLKTRHNARIKSGEIAILVKEHLFDRIKILKK